MVELKLYIVVDKFPNFPPSTSTDGSVSSIRLKSVQVALYDSLTSVTYVSVCVTVLPVMTCSLTCLLIYLRPNCLLLSIVDFLVDWNA